MNTEGEDRLHCWWELSYAEYLTIPRTAMQSMPDEWQGKMADLLKELDERIEWRPQHGCYQVQLREFSYQINGDGEEEFTWGRTLKDNLADYARGRRRISLKPPISIDSTE